MDIGKMLADLQAERQQIDKAIAALQALAGTGSTGRVGRRPGRPPKSAAAPKAPRRRRRMSASARKRISEMMKLRWAERKKKAK